MASIVDPASDSKSYHSDRWRSVIVDEDDFRLACQLVRHWHDTSDGSDPELIDRIAAALTSIRTRPNVEDPSVCGHPSVGGCARPYGHRGGHVAPSAYDATRPVWAEDRRLRGGGAR